MSINNISNYVLLAETAYVDFSEVDLSKSDKIKDAIAGKDLEDKTKIEDSLINFAKLIENNYTPLAHWKDSNSLFDGESGFSGTLFQAKDTGGFVLALKGTLGLKDLVVTDGTDIVLDGLAHHQIVDMYNFWQQINTPEGQSYQAAAIKTVAIDPLGAISLLDGTTAEGYFSNNKIVQQIYFTDSTEVYQDGRQFGLGIDVDTVTVTGHSLGGHLSAAFSRLFPEATEHAYMINGAGFGGSGNIVSAPELTRPTFNIQSVFHKLGGADQFDANKITNVIGDKNIDFVAQDWFIALNQPGQAHELFIEQPKVSSDTFGHGSGQMSDSMAVADLFIRLDAGLQQKPLKELLFFIDTVFEASAVDNANTLEHIVEKLYHLLNPEGSLEIKAEDRDALYGGILKVQELINNLGVQGSYTFESIPQDIGKLASIEGPDAVAYRYALLNLNPFVVKGLDYSAHNSNGSLDLQSPNNPNGMSEVFIEKRSELMQVYLKVASDKLPNALYTSDVEYTDKGEMFALSAYEYRNNHPVRSTNPAVVAFALNGEKDLAGGMKEDYLFTGTGNQTLDGKDGNDYMEGGMGFDTYMIQGSDTVYDSDNNGKIVFASSNVQAASFVNRPEDTPNYWYSVDEAGKRDGKMFAVKAGADLNVFHGQDKVTVKGFFDHAKKNGNALEALGMSLAVEDGAQEVKGESVIYGAGEADKYNVFYAGSGHTVNITGGHKDDIVFATATKGLILNAAGGNDRIFGSYAADMIDGGDGNDWINGSAYVPPTKLNAEMEADKDLIIGGSGNDIIWGAGGDDIIYAGARGEHLFESSSNLRGDWIAGGAGNDRVYGSRERDFLQGGSGSDTVQGGAGDDVILGDGEIRLDSRMLSIFNEPVYAPVYTPTSPIHPLVPWNGGTVSPSYSYGNVLTVEHTLNSGNWQKLPLNSASKTHPDSNQWDFSINTAQRDYHINNKLALASDAHRVGQRNADDEKEGAFNDFLYGGSGDDLIVGQDGDDLLHGGDGNDILWGDDNRNPDISGNDILVGGAGNNTLIGGKGFDTYIFDSRDLQAREANNRIIDSDGLGRIMIDGQYVETVNWQAEAAGRWSAKEQGWILHEENGSLHLSGNGFQTGITLENYHSGMFGLNLPAWAEQPTVENPEPQPVPDDSRQQEEPVPDTNRTEPPKGRYETPERTWSGNEDGDTLTGTDAREDLNGYGGDDIIDGMGGNDVINGGEGNDIMKGGAGADTYVFSGNWGRDTIISENAEDHIYFKDVRFSEVRLEREGQDLMVFKLNSEDQIRIQDQFEPETWEVQAIVNWEFADGQIFKSSEINNYIAGFENDKPAAMNYAVDSTASSTLDSYREAAMAGV
ncbi:calcium-binding protein [Neisseria wadsworthii]|uniref:calcium-binding protein n=1 Tax=Neisseria wadsworthii TaxID=607711 RepID=UPI000D316AD5|nr:calcium-binding protein [Neisseria wadsworthii]